MHGSCQIFQGKVGGGVVPFNLVTGWEHSLESPGT